MINLYINEKDKNFRLMRLLQKLIKENDIESIEYIELIGNLISEPQENLESLKKSYEIMTGIDFKTRYKYK